MEEGVDLPPVALMSRSATIHDLVEPQNIAETPVVEEAKGVVGSTLKDGRSTVLNTIPGKARKRKRRLGRYRGYDWPIKRRRLGNTNTKPSRKRASFAPTTLKEPKNSKTILANSSDFCKSCNSDGPDFQSQKSVDAEVFSKNDDLTVELEQDCVSKFENTGCICTRRECRAVNGSPTLAGNSRANLASFKARAPTFQDSKIVASGKASTAREQNIPEQRVLRPRRPQKSNKATLLKRLRDVKLCKADAERILGRRIKVYWPLDEKWYYGTVGAYDGSKGLHKIVYDDREEEWLVLENEKFKLQVSPVEVFGRSDSVRPGIFDGGTAVQVEGVTERDKVVVKNRAEDGCRKSCAFESASEMEETELQKASTNSALLPETDSRGSTRKSRLRGTIEQLNGRGVTRECRDRTVQGNVQNQDRVHMDDEVVHGKIIGFTKDNNLRSHNVELSYKVGPPAAIVEESPCVYVRRHRKIAASNTSLKPQEDVNLPTSYNNISNVNVCSPETTNQVIGWTDNRIQTELYLTLPCPSAHSGERGILNEHYAVDHTCDSGGVAAAMISSEECNNEEAISKSHIPAVVQEREDAMGFSVVLPLLSVQILPENEEGKQHSSLLTEDLSPLSALNDTELSDEVEPGSCEHLATSDSQTHATTLTKEECLTLTRVGEKCRIVASSIPSPLGAGLSAWDLNRALRSLISFSNPEAPIYARLEELFSILNRAGIFFSSACGSSEVIRGLLLAALGNMSSREWCSYRQIAFLKDGLWWKKLNGVFPARQEPGHSFPAPNGINRVTFQQIIDIFVCSLFKPSVWASLSHSSTFTTASLQGLLNHDKIGQLEGANLCQRRSRKSMVLGSSSLRLLPKKSLEEAKIVTDGCVRDDMLSENANCGTKQMFSAVQQSGTDPSTLVVDGDVILQRQRWRSPHASNSCTSDGLSYLSEVDANSFGICTTTTTTTTVDCQKLSGQGRDAVLEGEQGSGSSDFLTGLHSKMILKKRHYLPWTEACESMQRGAGVETNATRNDDPDASAGSMLEERVVPLAFKKGARTGKGWKRSMSHCIQFRADGEHSGGKGGDVKRTGSINSSRLITKKWKLKFAGKSPVQVELKEPVHSSVCEQYGSSNISGLSSARVSAASVCSCPGGEDPWHITGSSIQVQQGGLPTTCKDIRCYNSLGMPFSIAEARNVLHENWEQHGALHLPMSSASQTSASVNFEENPVDVGTQLNVGHSFDVRKQWAHHSLASFYSRRVDRKKRKRDSLNPGSTETSHLQSRGFGRRGRPRKEDTVTEQTPLYCTANLLIIDYDRGWRERGATVELALLNSSEWVIAAKVPGGSSYTHKVQPSAPTGTTNRHTHAMMWKGGNSWTLEFSDRKQWNSFKRMYEECGQRNARAASLKHIPIPGVREIEDSSVQVEGPKFLRPSMRYIHQTVGEVEAVLMSAHIAYDMDSEDEHWLDHVNDERAKIGESNLKPSISEEVLERMIDKLEKASFMQWHEPVSADMAVDICKALGSTDVIKLVHAYWCNKRQEKGMALVRHFQPAPWEIYQKRVQDWQAGSNDLQSQILPVSKPHFREQRVGPPMFAFCLRPRGLEVADKNKMQKHKLQRKLTSGWSLFRHGTSPTGPGMISYAKPYGEAVTEIASKDVANGLGVADTSLRGTALPLIKQPESSGHTFGRLKAGRQTMRTKNKQRKARRMRIITTTEESRRKQRAFLAQHMLARPRVVTHSDWRLASEAKSLTFFRPEDGDATILHNEAFDQLGVSGMAPQLSPSLDLFMNARQTRAKAAAARAAAATKYERSRRLFLKFDLALKKAFAALIELEVIHAVEEGAGRRDGGTQFSSTAYRQLETLKQKVGLLSSDYATKNRREVAVPIPGSWPVYCNDLNKHSKEASTDFLKDDPNYGDMKLTDADVTLLPVASWSRELDAGLGTALLQNTDKKDLRN